MTEEVAKFVLPRIMREARESLALTQLELAKMSGISRQSISYYETGFTTPVPQPFIIRPYW